MTNTPHDDDQHNTQPDDHQPSPPTDYRPIAEAIAADPVFNAAMSDVMRSVLDELSFMDGAVIRSDSSDAFMANLRINAVTSFYENLLARFPDDDPEELRHEAFQSTLLMAFDTGFRAGRLFHSRGHEIPL